MKIPAAAAMLFASLSAFATEPPPPLTLPDVVGALRTGSPRAAAARERMRAAEGARDQSWRPPNPGLELRLENWDPADRRTGAARIPLDVFAVATLPVELPGKRAARGRAADAAVTAAGAEERLAMRDLELEALAAYFGALRARALVETSAANLEGITRLVETMSRRVAEGYAAEADLLRFRAEEGRLAAQLERARLGLARETAKLTGLLRLAAPLDPARLVAPPPPRLPAGEPADLARSALSRRPEIAAAEARLDRARSLARLERARRLPDPAFSGGWKRTGGADTAVVGVSVPLPLFDANGGNVKRSAAEAEAAAHDLAGLRAQIEAETSARVVRARRLAERARSADAELLEPAAGAAEAARATFREGASDILRLVDAERVFADARRETAELKLDAIEAAVEAAISLEQEWSE